MTKVEAYYPDPEIETKDVLLEFAETGGFLEAYTVGVGLPTDWEPGRSPIHLSVACDGEFEQWHPIATRATVRVTAWGDTPTATKTAARLAKACLLTEPQTWPLTGVLPARDDETGAELASFTVRVILRSTPLP